MLCTIFFIRLQSDLDSHPFSISFFCTGRKSKFFGSHSIQQCISKKVWNFLLSNMHAFWFHQITWMHACRHGSTSTTNNKTKHATSFIVAAYCYSICGFPTFFRSVWTFDSTGWCMKLNMVSKQRSWVQISAFAFHNALALFLSTYRLIESWDSIDM